MVIEYHESYFIFTLNTNLEAELYLYIFFCSLVDCYSFKLLKTHKHLWINRHFAKKLQKKGVYKLHNVQINLSKALTVQYGFALIGRQVINSWYKSVNQKVQMRPIKPTHFSQLTGNRPIGLFGPEISV